MKKGRNLDKESQIVAEEEIEKEVEGVRSLQIEKVRKWIKEKAKKVPVSCEYI